MEMAGQQQNIIQAIKDYGSRLSGFIRSRVYSEEDAEDILQDVWYQLSSQTKLDDIESISGWLYRVAKNKITDSYRNRKNQRLDIPGNEEENEWMLPAFILNETTGPETEQLRMLFREAFFEALGELPENQRDVFIWNELDELTLQKIAERENENIKTIISRKRYAVQHLRRRLEFIYNEFLNY